MKPAPFTHHRPETVDETLERLEELGTPNSSRGTSRSAS